MNKKILLMSLILGAGLVPLTPKAGEPEAAGAVSSQFLSDAAITTKIRATLLADEQLKALEIHIDTSGGVVDLTGFAGSGAQINQAAEIARGVKGVKKVRNDIRLRTAAAN
ncbi:MAG TPA: BON domain-containing protein [Solimonas sp.]|nr:BON domain-containing protein [Solimonas sp.]